MRRGFGQSLRIGVSDAGMALLRASRWGSKSAAVLAQHAFAHGAGASAQQVAEGMRALFDNGDYARWPVTFVVGDDLARMWQVTPPQGAARLSDLHGAAALRFQSLYGEPASGWDIAAGWDAGASFMAAALPRATVAALAQGAAEHKLAVVEIIPQFLASWNRNCSLVHKDAWYGLVHDGVLTLGVPHGSRLDAVRAAKVPEGAGTAWVAAHVAREALRLDLAAPALVQLSGQVPQAWQGGGAGQPVALLDDTSAMAPLAALAATGSRA